MSARLGSEVINTMKRLVGDELWSIVEPLLPSGPSKPKGGRPRVPNRAVLEGIVFVLKSGIPRSLSDSRKERRFMELGGLSMSENSGLPA